jgi:beta-phosphoglucomutase-like phosphatase (HAD superfamily)
MGLSVGDVCVFEDSFVALETAKSAGFKTVGLYDKYSMGQDRLLAASDIYMKEGESLLDIIDSIED